MDIRSVSLYITGQMADYYQDVDLAYTYAPASGNNLLTMDAKNISFTDVGEEVEYMFPYQNKGELYRYTGATDADVRWFQSLSTAADVQRGYDSLLNVLTNRGGAEAQPVKRLANLQRRDIVLFRGINRKIKSIIYIEDVATAANGTMNMLIKSDMGEQIYFQKPDLPLANLTLKADTLVLEVSTPRADENYIDLLGRKVYKDVDLENDDVSQISLLHTWNGSITVFYTLTSAWIADSGYKPELWNWLQTLPNRRTIYLYRLDDKAAYVPGYTFEDVRNNNETLKQYGNDYIGNINSFASRIPGTTGQTAAAGMVYRIRDVGNDMWGLIKILSVDNATGTCRVALKYYHSEEV